jgi:Ca2+-binding EF-hand superfamily protein
MKRTLIFLLVLTLNGFSQEGGRAPGGGMRMSPMRMSPSMRILDADQDGVISAAEIAQAGARFAAMDRNGDAKLTEDELRPQGGPGPGPGRQEGGPRGEASAMSAEDTVNAMMQFDRNKDGRLTKDEVPERMQGVFARNDANQDGILTREELLQAAARQSQSAERAEGGRRGGPGGPGGFLRMDPVFAALDADQNGEISQAEWNNAPAALAKLDKNQDGQLTFDEVRPQFPGGGRRGPGGGDHDHD